MSMSPSRLLQRLQDLRVWQQSQEDLLLLNKQKKSGSDSNVNNQNETARASDYNTIEGLSAFDSTFDEECGGDVPRTDSKDCWESKPISPAKPFEQLLAEKLAEDVNQAEGDGRAGGPRPRQPFLRKGSGLQRFRMKPGDQAKIPPHPRRSKSKPRPPGPRKKLEKSSEKPLENPEVVNTLKKTEVAGILLTPLKVPNLSIKPKAVWCPVVQQQPAETDVTVEVTPALTAGPSEQTLYEKQLEKELMIFEALERRADNSSFCSTNSSVVQLLSQISNNQNNSNNPNNSSTPGKKNPVLVEKTAPLTRVEEELEKHVRWDEETSPPSPVAGQPRALLREENIAQLLLQLQKIADFNTKSKATVAGCVEVVAAQRQQQQQLLSTPFSEESEDTSSSSATTEHSLSDSISSTDLDTTLKEKSKQDAAVGTSDAPLHGDRCCQSAFHEKQKFLHQQDDKQQIKSLSCDFCQNQLDRKYTEYTEKIDGLGREKSSLANLRRDLQQKAQSLEENFEKRLKEVEEERKLFLYELESDRKKLAKEKALVQSYIKDTQNKKDRDEVKTLKQEVADLRETLKLKETKNGQTQARLRNQVKQLEKENARLKDDIERLQKDNAKLTAAQKLQQQQRHINKSADSKILQEINKNITKMAKEAAATMNITRDREPSRERSNQSQISPISQKRRKSSENNNNNNSSKSRTLSGDQKESLVEQDEEDRDGDRTNEQRRRGRITTTTDTYRKSDDLDDSLLLLDTTNFRNLSYGANEATAGIQKQYESVFLRRNLTLNDSKNKERTERLLDDGSKEIKYSNGNTKTVSADGNFAVMRYYNGDIKETWLTDGIVKYFYKDKNIWQTSYPDGTELIEFPEGPKERRFQDGKCEVTFPDGMFQTVFPDGNQEVVYPDGSRLQIKTDGEKILHLPNGQREIQTKEHKRREYPDGTVKILYPDGSQETRYSNGRVRMKDPQGHLIMDTHQPQT